MSQQAASFHLFAGGSKIVVVALETILLSEHGAQDLPEYHHAHCWRPSLEMSGHHD